MIDAELIKLIEKRTAASREIRRIRGQSGGPRIVPTREEEIRARYKELGDEGDAIISALLRLGRGPDEAA